MTVSVFYLAALFLLGRTRWEITMMGLMAFKDNTFLDGMDNLWLDMCRKSSNLRAFHMLRTCSHSHRHYL